MNLLATWGKFLQPSGYFTAINWSLTFLTSFCFCSVMTKFELMTLILKLNYIVQSFVQLSKFLRQSLMIFIIKCFWTTVFIFIVIFTTFRLICPPAFFRCLLNSGTYTELQTTSFIDGEAPAILEWECEVPLHYHCSKVLSMGQVELFDI